MLADGNNTYLYGLSRIGEQQLGGFAYHLPDALGSVRQLANASASVTLARSYEPYGSVMSSAGSGSSVFAFTGEQYDASTNLLYLRARYYSGAQGRFLTADTSAGDAHRPMSYNAWLYGYANPVNLTDPSGHDPCDGFSGQDKEQCYLYWALILTGGYLQAQQETEYYAQQFVAGAAFEFLSNESLGLTAATDPYSAARTDAPFVTGRMAGRGASLGLSVAEILFGGGCAGGGLIASPTGVGVLVAVGGVGLTAHGLGVIYRGLTTPLPNIYFASSQGAGQGSSGTIPATRPPDRRGGLRRAMEAVGIPKPAGMTNPQAHHNLPWKFKDWFAGKGRGLNVNEAQFGRWVEGTQPGSHQRWTQAYEREWTQWIAKNPKATRQEVLEFLNQLLSSGRFPSQ